MKTQGFVLAATVVLVALVPGSADGQCQYEAAVIQAPPTMLFVEGLGLNGRGDVVGYWRTIFNAGEDMAFLWTQEAGFVTLELPVDVFRSRAIDVNDAGQVAGRVDINGLGTFAFVYGSDGFTIIAPPPGGDFSEATAISNKGAVAGTTSNSTFHRAFRWQDGIMEVIEPTFGPRSIGLDINENGHVVGYMGTSQVIDSHAFVWDGARVTDLGVPPGCVTAKATAINNLGHVTIWALCQSGDDHVVRSFLWDGEQFIDLGILTGYDSCGPVDLNDFDQVLGVCNKLSNPGDQRAFLWQDGSLIDLTLLVIPKGVSLSPSVRAFNESGQIAGSGGIGRNADFEPVHCGLRRSDGWAFAPQTLTVTARWASSTS